MKKTIYAIDVSGGPMNEMSEKGSSAIPILFENIGVKDRNADVVLFDKDARKLNGDQIEDFKENGTENLDAGYAAADYFSFIPLLEKLKGDGESRIVIIGDLDQDITASEAIYKVQKDTGCKTLKSCFSKSLGKLCENAKCTVINPSKKVPASKNTFDCAVISPKMDVSSCYSARSGIAPGMEGMSEWVSMLRCFDEKIIPSSLKEDCKGSI